MHMLIKWNNMISSLCANRSNIVFRKCHIKTEYKINFKMKLRNEKDKTIFMEPFKRLKLNWWIQSTQSPYLSDSLPMPTIMRKAYLKKVTFLLWIPDMKSNFEWMNSPVEERCKIISDLNETLKDMFLTNQVCCTSILSCRCLCQTNIC